MRAATDLQDIPGIGPSMEVDLMDLGFGTVRNLEGRDPARMYADLCDLRGARLDRCVLYVFRCAVYFSETRRPDPELLKWWKWKDRRHANERVAA